MILYTSGTTGLPKGVVLSASAIATDLDLLAEAWAWTADDLLVHGLPLFHVHGLILGVLGPLRIGSRLVHTGKPTPAAYASASGSLYFGVPTVWSRLAADPSSARALRGARLLISGSAALPVPVFETLQTLAGQGPIERYGMTETLITVSGRPAGVRRPGWVGQALAGVATRLVDTPSDGESVGALEVRSPTTMSGYLHRPDETAAITTSDGWIRTGDVACIDGDGWHRIVGRESTDLIKSGGYRIGAGEVEAALMAHPGVAEAAVVGEPDDDLGQVVVAYVVAEGVTGDDLCDFVARSLSVHKRPRRVTLVAGLPRNAMGKVQKKLLLGRD
jgi:fatty acid CoA ligase FadD36